MSEHGHMLKDKYTPAYVDTVQAYLFSYYNRSSLNVSLFQFLGY